MELPISIPIKRFSHCYNLPQYATPGSAEMDLYAGISNLVLLQPNEKQCIPTGIAIKLPEGYEGQIRPCSRLRNVEIISADTIDSDYNDEIKINMINRGKTTCKILPGAIIAKIVITKYTKITWKIIKDDFSCADLTVATSNVKSAPRHKGAQEREAKVLGLIEDRPSLTFPDLCSKVRLTDASDASDASDEEPLHRLRISLALFDTSEFARISEAKNILQELLVENNLPLPKYATEFEGPTNDKIFNGTVTVQYSYGGHTMVAKGEPELTKKDAEKSAAFSVLRKLKSSRSAVVNTSGRIF